MLCARGYWDIPKGNEGDDLQRLEETLMKTSLFPCSTLTYIPSKAGKHMGDAFLYKLRCIYLDVLAYQVTSTTSSQ